jgi:hypothetical protein
MHFTFKEDSDDNVAKLTAYLADKGQKDVEIKNIPAGIEDYFIKISETGHE